MSPSESTYPPAKHLLRDLRIVVDRVDGDVTAQLEADPMLADASGRVRVGVLATLVDVVAGEMAIRSVLPNWTATSDLSVYVSEIPNQGSIEASARILRAGRQTVILEAQLREVTTGREIGVAQVGFAVLEARGGAQSSGHWAEAPSARTEFGLADSRFERPLLEAMGVEFEPGNCAVARLGGSVPPFLINSLGALQGGAGAILLEAAAEHFAAAALDGPVRVRSLAIHYLKLGRIGPIRADSRRIARSAGGMIVHVELHDEGAEDVLLTVATIQVDEATAFA